MMLKNRYVCFALLLMSQCTLCLTDKVATLDDHDEHLRRKEAQAFYKFNELLDKFDFDWEPPHSMNKTVEAKWNAEVDKMKTWELMALMDRCKSHYSDSEMNAATSGVKDVKMTLATMLLAKEEMREKTTQRNHHEISIGRGLQVDYSWHEDVPTNIQPNSTAVADDWAHDFNILKPIMLARGFETSATSLCELPNVLCTTGAVADSKGVMQGGFRRRIPTYSLDTMGTPDTWEGTDYMLHLAFKDQTKPTPFEPQLMELKRVVWFQVFVNTGAMPSGLERLPHINRGSFWLEGNVTHGIEGGLPPGFWSAPIRRLAFSSHGPQFTGSFPSEIPMCDHLSVALTIINNKGFSGDLTVLKRCRKLPFVVVSGAATVFGNGWEVMLGLEQLTFVYFSKHLSGPVPYGSTSTLANDDAWVQWCRQKKYLVILVGQVVGGPIPAGLKECGSKIVTLGIWWSSITGHWPFDLSKAYFMSGLDSSLSIYGNSFTGPLPDLPPQFTQIQVYVNQWTGDIPDSWMKTKLQQAALHDCNMVGGLPRLPPTLQTYKLSGNRFSGMVPDSWFNQSLAFGVPAKLEVLDLSGNQLSGPLFSWGWPSADTQKGLSRENSVDAKDLLSAHKPSPRWPLKQITLSGNPLGISVGFLLSQLSYYELESILADNCGLTRHAQNIIPHAYSVRYRSIVNDDTRPGFKSLLSVLDLSSNNITSFGWTYKPDLYKDRASCWSDPGDGIFSDLDSLKELILKECVNLKSLHAQAYHFDKIDVRGTRSLVSPPVGANSSDCSFNKEMETCPLTEYTDALSLSGVGVSAAPCLYRIPVYTAMDGATSECAIMGRKVVTPILKDKTPILSDPQLFKPEVLCRCFAGYQGTGTSCSECPQDTWSAKGSSLCSACPPYSTTLGLKLVTSSLGCQCNPGTYLALGMNAGQYQCTKCPVNTMRKTAGAKSVSDCTGCETGFYALLGGSDCHQCPPGTVAAGGQGDGCACASGFFTKKEAYPFCNQCLGGKITEGLATSASGCVCPAGTLEDDNGQCVPCGTGIDCRWCPAGALEDDNGECLRRNKEPMSKAGFYAGERHQLPKEAFVDVHGKYSVFKCYTDAKRCPHGKIGECAEGRTGIACSECLPGMTSGDEGTCSPCKGSNTLMFVFLVLCGLTLLFVLYRVVTNENRAKQRHSWVVVGLVGGIMVTFVQQMAVFSSMEIPWGHPIKAMLTAFRVISFDIEILQVACVVAVSSVASFAMRLSALFGFLMCMVVIHFAWVCLRHAGKNIASHNSSLVCILGTIIMVFLTSIVNASVAPLQCIEQPNGLATVLAYPGVICWEQSGHGFMMIMGIGFLLLPIGFVAFCCFVAYQYPKRTTALDTAWLHMFAFLFFRFKPMTYWYSIIFVLRNMLIGLCPILPGPVAQTSAMLAVLIASVVSVSNLTPWRVHKVNYLDLLVTSATIGLLCISGFFVIDANPQDVATLCTVILSLILMFLVGAMSFSVLVPIVNKNVKEFQYFICHHKLGAGAFARLLKTVLEVRTLRSKAVRVFIDCDNLTNLETLFDKVGDKTETVVVLKSRELLLRPWCIGELVTVHLNQPQTKMIPIELADYIAPTDLFVTNFGENVNISDLGPHGIDVGMVQAMMGWFLDQTSVKIPPNEPLDNAMVEDIANILGENLRSGLRDIMPVQERLNKARASRAVAPNPKNLIVTDGTSDEQIATALVLCKFMAPLLVHDQSGIPEVLISDNGPMMPETQTVVMLWSSGVFTNVGIISIVVRAAVQVLNHIPIFAEIGFRFPAMTALKTAMGNLATKMNKKDFGGVDMAMDPDAVVELIAGLFGEIAVEFTPQDYSSTESLLIVKAAKVADKLVRNKGAKIVSSRISRSISQSEPQSASAELAKEDQPTDGNAESDKLSPQLAYAEAAI